MKGSKKAYPSFYHLANHQAITQNAHHTPALDPPASNKQLSYKAAHQQSRIATKNHNNKAAQQQNCTSTK
ncbi:MAG: hypothetical protein II041_00405, partial [Bacteroidales bacterium]|nr:hypothetical protein [Bacteroidales bacterium]